MAITITATATAPAAVVLTGAGDEVHHGPEHADGRERDSPACAGALQRPRRRDAMLRTRGRHVHSHRLQADVEGVHRSRLCGRVPPLSRAQIPVVRVRGWAPRWFVCAPALWPTEMGCRKSSTTGLEWACTLSSTKRALGAVSFRLEVSRSGCLDTPHASTAGP